MENNLSCNVSVHEEEMDEGKKVFVVECMELGVSDHGDALNEALDNLRKAINLLLESAPGKKELLIQLNLYQKLFKRYSFKM